MKDIPISAEFKYGNLFVVKFPIQFNIEEWSLKKIDKPKYTNGKWENIRIDFVDPIRPSTSQSLFGIVKFLENNKSDDKRLFDFTINSLDITGKIIEEWLVSVEKVITINFGELEYANDDIQKPYMIVRPLYCFLRY